MNRKIFILNQEFKDFINIKDHKIIHRLSKVLKLKKGETIHLINNFEEESEYKILDDQNWILQRLSIQKRALEPKRKINLYFSLIKKNKIEFIIEKGSEMGVYKFYPLITKRSSLKINYIPNRWYKIIGKSLETTSWKHYPQINQIQTFKKVSQHLDKNSFFTAEKSGEKINLDKLPKEINLIIGPEGGFDPEELKILKEKTNLISLGDFNLKSETAMIIFLSLLNFG